jgi:hypothetical protein
MDVISGKCLFTKNRRPNIRSEVLAAVVVWDIMPYNPFKVDLHFRGTNLCVQGRKIIRGRNPAD